MLKCNFIERSRHPVARGRSAVGNSTAEYEDRVIGGDIFHVSKEKGRVN